MSYSALELWAVSMSGASLAVSIWAVRSVVKERRSRRDARWEALLEPLHAITLALLHEVEQMRLAAQAEPTPEDALEFGQLESLEHAWETIRRGRSEVRVSLAEQCRNVDKLWRNVLAATPSGTFIGRDEAFFTALPLKFHDLMFDDDGRLRAFRREEESLERGREIFVEELAELHQSLSTFLADLRRKLYP